MAFLKVLGLSFRFNVLNISTFRCFFIRPSLNVFDGRNAYHIPKTKRLAGIEFKHYLSLPLSSGSGDDSLDDFGVRRVTPIKADYRLSDQGLSGS